ncbi:glycosyltransferase family 4 protein [Pseudocolwellia agarivorans]|uniref:glycosyltransferase family 4 protein n=1 Tax=Pseudocolwellia agarivorans TaxID=1911682 RepID=UPI003F880F98
MKNKITIYQRVLPHYRVPFFERLHEVLLENGVELQVICGHEKEGTVPKTVKIDAPWAIYMPVTYFNLFGAELVFQYPRLCDFKSGNVVIIEQANRLLINYVFYFLRALKIIKLGLWGHGKNFQATNKQSLKERFKRTYTTFSDWWFCYTTSGKKILNELGYEDNKITVVRNCVDVNELIDERNRLSQNELNELKSELNITTNNVAVYCGGMYTEKHIPFLLKACSNIQKITNDFNVIFIGNGPDDYLVKDFCETKVWAHYLGPISGVERVKYFAISKVTLMPGLVGLAVLDSFALQVPMITTDIPIHSPEIEYLESGVNGLIVEHDVNLYAEKVCYLLNNNYELEILVSGCKDCIDIYSIEVMANNYANGVIKLLS